MARPAVQGSEARDDWLPLLDEELSRLPEKYRLPIIFCDLEGRTRQEAAKHLRWPEGNVAGRLARGRAMLAKRLARRGVTVPAAVLAASLAQKASACVPPLMISSTVKAASLIAAGQAAAEGVISAKVFTLTGEIMKAMLLNKLKNVAVVLALCVFAGAGWLGYRSFGTESDRAFLRGDNPRQVAKKRPEPKEEQVKKAVHEKVDEAKDANSEKEKSSAGAGRSHLVALLEEPLDLSKFQRTMTLKETLELFYEAFKDKDKEVPFLIDTQAFQQENSAEPFPVYDSQIKFPEYPKTLRAVDAIKFAVSQIPGDKAEILLRDGVVWITTQKQTSLNQLLQERVCASFDDSLAIVVHRLSEKSGVSITLDPRAEENTKTRIVVSFRNDVTLGAALRIIADMAGLKLVDMQSGLYITTPENAKELEKELRESRK